MASQLTRAGSTAAWRRIRTHVLIRDEWTCRVPVTPDGTASDRAADPECGVALTEGDPEAPDAATVDHIVPRWLCAERGIYADELSNLRGACRRHNLQRQLQDRDAARAGALTTSREW